MRRAATLVYFQVELTNPKGKAVDVELARLIVERYGFLKYPQTFADFNNQQEGTVFGMGSWRDVRIEEMKIFSNGILVATGESTDVADAMFSDMMTLWPEVGLSFDTSLITQRAYVSQLVFHSEMDLGTLNPKISTLVSDTFETQTGIGILGFHTGNPDLSPIQIQRLTGAPLTSNQYWAQAPLPTLKHLAFLLAFEAALS